MTTITITELASMIANSIIKELAARKSDSEFVIKVDDGEILSRDAQIDNDLLQHKR